VEEDDDLYDCVEEDENEGDDIYEDLMRTEEPETVRHTHTHTYTHKHTHTEELQNELSVCHSSRKLKWTRGVAVFRKSDRLRRNTQAHWNQYFR